MKKNKDLIEILSKEIKNLDMRKKKLNENFSAYELKEHLEVFIELQGIDKAREILANILIDELEKEG